VGGVIPSVGSTAVRRHTMGNVHVAEQTKTTAKVCTYLFISAVPGAGKLNILSSGTYNATMGSTSVLRGSSRVRT
jgi:hypothetical protein